MEKQIDLLGNPVHNTAVKGLYLKQITGKDSPNKDTPKTTTEATQTEIDFGSFDKSEIKEATIEVKNIGDNPLSNEKKSIIFILVLHKNNKFI